MLEIRWHSRTGQGAVTGAKALAAIVVKTGKHAQAFAFYGSIKTGASMTAFNRINDEEILSHEKYVQPNYVFICDEKLTYTDDITLNCTSETKYIITSKLCKEEIIAKVPKLQGIQKNIFVLDCFQISKDTMGKAYPNTPILGAFIKVSGIFELDDFKENMKDVLKKLPQKLIDANIKAITRAYEEVK